MTLDRILSEACPRSPIRPPLVVNSKGVTLPPVLAIPNLSHFETDERPDPAKYNDSTLKRGQELKQIVHNFFREQVRHARDRDRRGHDLEVRLTRSNLAEAARREARHVLVRQEVQHLRFLRHREGIENFTPIKVIGKGAFGLVRLVRRREDGRFYALKSLSKSDMLLTSQLGHVRAERDLLVDAKDNPWLVKLHAAFQDQTFLYLLMDFVPGGDLMTWLTVWGVFPEDVTRFYMAELVMAVEAVHRLGFCHRYLAPFQPRVLPNLLIESDRDIKPDNILLDRTGHVKLSDFGLSTAGRRRHHQVFYQALLQHSTHRQCAQAAGVSPVEDFHLTFNQLKQVDSRRQTRRHVSYSMVGTPDYMAPETVLGGGYDYRCDWWAVGAIMFECLMGQAPFRGKDFSSTLDKIVNWQVFLKFPSEPIINRAARVLIQRLLCDADNRLGQDGGHHGEALSIKQDAFFRRVGWNTLRQMPAPFQPTLTSPSDVRYFLTEDIPPHSPPAKHPTTDPGNVSPYDARMSLPFIGYTYKAFTAFQDI